ncbi:hypothetical protein CNR22_23270 [Sphingobacteriaceae bacterium]|nr:hypothetical protein CNR22_23270 [Sphingobacteriaceae bacterium]
MSKTKNNKPKTKLTQAAAVKDGKITGLEVLVNRRTGGANNIRGVEFQLLYSCFLILTMLDKESHQIRLEGIEDIDFLGEIDTTEYVQLKTSKNIIGASAFWEMKVLQNFLEAYKIDPAAKFKLVHNSAFTEGKLRGLFNRNYSNETLEYWKNRFKENGFDVLGIDFPAFIAAITIEKTNEIDLLNNCLKLLAKKYCLNVGTEKQYFNALFNSVFQWSKNRSTISKKNVDELIVLTTESFSKAPVNPAIQNSWLLPVNFEMTESTDIMDYFDGKAAKPIHIANNLPVKRPLWEKEIQESATGFDVTVIRASSGQGKSTLAWQASYSLLTEGYTIFQLNYCKDWDQASQIYDLIESRIYIGQIPLIVIDGLGHMVEGWGILAERLKERPVKFLITAREEDWVRYGYDHSKIKIKPVQIKLSQQEAREIYLQLKEKGKISADNNGWQEAWEKVEAKGLLIEYVYLLTRGQMLAERLQEQVKQLANENSGAAKAEILRLIALADIMDIKLETNRITQHIINTVRFDTDRNEVYRQLEQEYYIRFNEKYVEGLHPIRSRHLVDILHSSIQVSETLLQLFSIINSEYIFEFFKAVPSLISASEKDEIYKEVATALATKEVPNLVRALDGLMKYEAEKFWLANRSTFDRVATNIPAALEVFIFDTLPYTKLNMLRRLKEIDNNNSNYDEVIGLLDGLSPYDASKTDLFIFLKKLSLKIKPIDNPHSFKGLDFLARWYKCLNIEVPVLVNVNDDILLNVLRKQELDEAAELFGYYQVAFPVKYKQFTIKNKKEIISLLKKHTDTLAVEEDGGDIHIKYFLGADTGKANHQSMKRIDALSSFLPDYDRYCSKAIVLPFPYQQIFDVVIQDSVKQISKANLEDKFDVHINQIWHGALVANYRVGSLYEWQMQYIEIRQAGIEFAKKCVRLFEAYLEQNQARIKSAAQEWASPADKLLKSINSSKKLPKYNKDYIEKDKYKTEEETIKSWCTSLTNFRNQMVNIVAPKGNNDRNLAVINLDAVEYKLRAMQQAYNKITQETFDYYPTDELCSLELTWYSRLLKTVLFYVHMINAKNPGRIFVIKTDIERWYENTEKQKLEQLHSIIKGGAHDGLTLMLPDKIIKNENLKYAEIGIEGANLTDLSEDFTILVNKMLDFDKTEINFFTFVFISQGKAVCGIRVTKDYFSVIRKSIETGEFDKEEIDNPLPLFADNLKISSLPGVEVQKNIENIKDEAFFKIMQLLGKFLDYRENLDTDSDIESTWLSEINKQYRSEIEGMYSAAKSNLTVEEIEVFDECIEGCLGTGDISKQDVVDFMNHRLKSINLR